MREPPCSVYEATDDHLLAPHVLRQSTHKGVVWRRATLSRAVSQIQYMESLEMDPLLSRSINLQRVDRNAVELPPPATRSFQ